MPSHQPASNDYLQSVSHPKMGRIKKSRLLFRGSLRTLRADKELVLLPLMGALIAIVIITACIAALILNPHLISSLGERVGDDTQLNPIGYAIALTIGALISAIGVVFNGAIIHGALQRFSGHDPTVGSSLRAAFKRAGSLLGFGAFSFLVGYLLTAIAERIPVIGGKIIVWLANSAWRAASFFAVPVIVTSHSAIDPITATKQSVGILKKVWGESLIVSAGITVIATLVYVIHGVLGGILMQIALLQRWDGSVLVGTAVLWVVGYLIMALVFTALESIARAAIYYYAVTGVSPATFDTRIMQQAFTYKKAGKVFSL